MIVYDILLGQNLKKDITNEIITEGENQYSLENQQKKAIEEPILLQEREKNIPKGELIEETIQIKENIILKGVSIQ